MVVLQTPHSLALVGNTSKPKVLSSSSTYDQKAMPGQAAWTVNETCFEVVDAITPTTGLAAATAHPSVWSPPR
jgi:hypothetical protein